MVYCLLDMLAIITVTNTGCFAPTTVAWESTVKLIENDAIDTIEARDSVRKDIFGGREDTNTYSFFNNVANNATEVNNGDNASTGMDGNTDDNHGTKWEQVKQLSWGESQAVARYWHKSRPRNWDPQLPR